MRGTAVRFSKKFYAGRFFRVLYALALLLGGILFAGQGKCYGQESLPENVFYTNQDTGYRVLVEDGAELLTEEERLELYSGDAGNYSIWKCGVCNGRKQ